MAGTGTLMPSALTVSIKNCFDQLLEAIQQFDINNIVRDLRSRFSRVEQLQVSSSPVLENQAKTFMQILLEKDDEAKLDFIHYLNKHLPDNQAIQYLMECVNDQSQRAGSQHSSEDSPRGNDVTYNSNENASSQSFQLSLHLALKERDNSLRESAKLEKEKGELLEKLEQLRVERDRAIESLNGEKAERTLDQSLDMNGHSEEIAEKLGLIESEIIDTGTDKVIWETHRVTLERIPGFGFGIAVSGGKDNPHFSNGDPSIAISDVLKAGPAENKLQINDRVLSVNGVCLDQVEHSDAIALLKDSGNQVELVVKRKILVPDPLALQPTKIQLQKRNKKDEYGIILGCKFYVKEIVGNSLAAFDGAIKEGDAILKINNISVEAISLQEARRHVEKSKEKLQLTLKKPPRAPSVTNLLHKRQNSDLDYTKFQPKSDNVYMSGSQHDKADYVKPSINSYVKSTEHLLSPYRVPEIQPQSPYRTPDASMVQSMHGSLAEPPQPVYEARDYYGGETRYIAYNKEGGGAGLRIAGGNHTGIFIAGVQDGSPAQREGVREGDEIIKVDGQPTRSMTREEAVLKIMNLDERVDLVVRNRINEFRRVLASSGSDSGDSFHIRTHMTYEAPKGSNHLSYKPGDIFKVTDTLRSGVIGEWNVIKLEGNNDETLRGVIPNKARAEAFRRPKEERDKPGRGSIFRRKSQKRSKSLGRDHWEDVVFAKEATKHPAYERIVQREPGFMRPVVIYGGVSDIAQDRLIREVSDLFAAPPSSLDREDEEVSKSGIIKLGCIRAVIDLGKHCVLDVVPSAVDKLNYAQYYPIVINLKTDRKEVVKDLRMKCSAVAAKASKKIFEQSQKIEKAYPHIFTKEIELNTTQDWFTQLREAVAKEQVRSIWMSEYKPTENMADDFLFPMANRMSYMASPESDMDTSRTSEQMYSMTTLERNMARASSDPSLDISDDPTSTAPHTPSIPAKQSANIRVPLSDQSDNFSNSMYAPRGHYGSAGHRIQRDRMASDSRVHYHAPFNGQNSVDRRHRHRSNDPRLSESESESGTNRTSHYQSPRSAKTTSAHDPYKFTRLSSSPGYNKSKPAPPVRRSYSMNVPRRSDSMGTNPQSGMYSENPYGQPRTPHRRLNHSLSLDPRMANGDDSKIRNYENSNSRMYHDDQNPYAPGRTRRPSGPTAGLPHSPAPTGVSNGFFNSTPIPRSPRVNGHYAAPHNMMSRSMSAATGGSGDEVFHAMPAIVPPPPISTSHSLSASFSNQVYMDSKEASDVVGPPTNGSSQHSTHQNPNRPASSFENYKKFATTTPFYGAKRDLPPEPNSAFESYQKDDPANMIEMEPTPENHILLDTRTGTFDSSGGILSSEATGVSIYFPPNAIPNGIKQKVYFKVCQQDSSLMSSLDKDKGETLLSPLVMCGPHGLKFQLPVELRLPHNATENGDSWNYSLKSSNDTTETNNWQSINLSSADPQNRTNSNTVSVLVDHF